MERRCYFVRDANESDDRNYIRRFFHDFETIEGRSFSNKEQEKHKKYIFDVTL